MNEIRTNGVDRSQMAGVQADSARPRKESANAAGEKTGLSVGDQVEIGQDAGAHTGMLQDSSKRLSDIGRAMSDGKLKVGDVAPGSGEPQAVTGEQGGAATSDPTAAATGQPQAGQAQAGQAQPGVAQPKAGPTLAEQQLAAAAAGQGQGGAAAAATARAQRQQGLLNDISALKERLAQQQAAGDQQGAAQTQALLQQKVGQLNSQDDSLAAAAQRAQASQQDAQQAQTIYWQMAADRQKAMTDIWKIFQDLQTTIFQKMQEVMIYRQQVMDKISQKWSEVLRGA